MTKKLKMILPILSLTLLLMPGSVSTAANNLVAEDIIVITANNDNETVMPMSDDIRWVYYTGADGRRYKRLFNYSTGQWIGDPILIS